MPVGTSGCTYLCTRRCFRKWGLKGQVWTRHLAPAVPAFPRPSLPSQFIACPTGHLNFRKCVWGVVLRLRKAWFKATPKSAEARGCRVWTSPYWHRGGGGSTWCRSLVPQNIILNTLDPHSLDPGQRLKTLSYIQQTSCVKIGLCHLESGLSFRSEHLMSGLSDRGTHSTTMA